MGGGLDFGASVVPGFTKTEISGSGFWFMSSEKKLARYRKYLIILLNGLTVGLVALLGSVWIFPNFWLGELAVSFWPQQVVFVLGIFLLNLANWWSRRSKDWSFEKWLNLVTGILTMVVLVWGLFQVYNFAWQAPEFSGSKETSQGFRVAVFNKLFTNASFGQVEQIIREVDAHVVGFVEISPVSPLRASLAAKYPYQAWSFDETEVGAAFLANVAIFSKTELTDVEFVENSGSPILAANTVVEGREYQLTLVHPFAPYLPRLLPDRNDQLRQIAQFVGEQRQDTPRILMGDFNTTPWSPAYRELVVDLEGMYNTAQGRGINFTWDALRFKGLTAEANSILFQAHIDHIFVSEDLRTLDYKVEGNYGSDHNLVWVELIL
jgi:endonuclease/exonuclease/phosphatase (EEP) superfamily protein YafD